MLAAPIEAPDQELLGVHIFRAGTYTLVNADGSKETVKYTDDDVAQMAENANALLAAKLHEPPAKLGHDDDQAFAKMAGLPAVGWAKRVVARGKDLFADFQQVPATMAEAIRRGRYKKISSEIYGPEQTKANFGDAVKGFTLRAVAILGADVPVVKGMNTLTLNPLMLGEGHAFCAAEGGIVTLEAQMSHKFGEDGKKPLMVPANRHPYGALCKMDEDEEPKKVHAIHPDGTYDVHDLHNSDKVHKKVGHDNLTLLSEMEMRTLTKKEEANMEKDEVIKLAEQKAADANVALLAEQAKSKALEAKITEDRITAFSEKNKAFLKQPPLLAAFKALAKAQPGAPIKLSEGKEQPYLEALMAFAESLLASKPVLFGEVVPATAGKEGEMGKSVAVKLAEQDFKAYAEDRGIAHIDNATVAVAAREYAEKNKVPYRAALLKVASQRLRYDRASHQYAEIIEAEVA